MPPDLHRRALLRALLGVGALWRTGYTRDNLSVPTNNQLSLLLAGDVMTGRGIDQILRHSVDPVLYEPYVQDANRYVELAEQTSGRIPRPVEPDYIWGDAVDVLDSLKPDVRIINLETAVTTADKPWPDKGIHYRMHPRNVDVLTAVGIDCCVLANNHTLDWGRPGLAETLARLREAGVVPVGAGADAPEASAPAVLNPPGSARLLVYALAEPGAGIPSDWQAGSGVSGVNFLPEVTEASASRLAGIVESTRRPGDRVVVSVHWGGNWGYSIPSEQRSFARRLIDDAGVDIVYGHSSHHPKGLELYRDKLILYGCGDLINDYEGIGGHESYRPELTAMYLPALAPDTGRLKSLTVVPFRLQKLRLNRTTSQEARWLAERLNRESQGGEFEIDERGFFRLKS